MSIKDLIDIYTVKIAEEAYAVVEVKQSDIETDSNAYRQNEQQKRSIDKGLFDTASNSVDVLIEQIS